MCWTHATCRIEDLRVSVGNRKTFKTSPEAMSRISKSPSLQPTAIAFPVEQKLTATGIDVPDPVKSDELLKSTFSLHVLQKGQKSNLNPLNEVHPSLSYSNLMYHESVRKTESAPRLLRMTIKSIVGHRSTALTDSDLELQIVKLSDMTE